MVTANDGKGRYVPPYLHVRADVRAALERGEPVVALESTLIAHGLPRPENLLLAREVEAIVRREGAIPATIGVIDGAAVIGLDAAQLERIAISPDIPKLSARDLPLALAMGRDGATTVAGTAFLAARAGIRVLATGGLGGVHRGARESWDESSDLATLSRTPITVVCAGVKSILDVGATLERLETLNVAVVGFRTRRFPGFYLADSGYALDWQVESEDEVAAIMAAQEALRLDQGRTTTADPSVIRPWSNALGGALGALVVANPLPVDEQLDPALHDRALAEGLAEVERRGIRGKAVTPFLLDHFRAATGGESVRVNQQIIRHNARLAARIACAWSRRLQSAGPHPRRGG
jgi:pseudouridine-5'-phosphate glycosidase